MKNLLTTLVAIIVLLINQKLISQPLNKATNSVVLPSYNATALGKFTDIPTGGFTGVPNIAIPLFTVSDGPLSVPINLTYHSAGLKPAELSSWVGAGWNLDCGGMISRTVLGLPDETYPGGYYHMGKDLTLSDNEQFEVHAGLRDAEPDLFSFNVNGLSGKFLIDKNGTVQLMPRQDLKITYAFDNNTKEFLSFTIIDPFGKKYYLGNLPEQNSGTGLERSVVWKDFDQNIELEYTSGWHLLRVESHDLVNNIDLQYEDENYNNRTLSTCAFKQYSSIDPICESDWSQVCGGQPYNGKNVELVRVKGKRLTKITALVFEINFIATTPREDLDGWDAKTAKKLDAIEIHTGQKCIKYALAHSYFADQNYQFNSPEKFRLKLDMLTKWSCETGESEPPYIFDYEIDPALRYPNRLTYATDIYGFANGKYKNDTYKVNIPPIIRVVPFYRYPLIMNSQGKSDRRSFEVAMKQGVLKNIRYPTGGSTSYKFEVNRVFLESPADGGFISKIADLKTCEVEPINFQCCTQTFKYSDQISFPSFNSINAAKFKVTYAAVQPFQQSQFCYLNINPPYSTCLLKVYNEENQLIGTKYWEPDPMVGGVFEETIDLTELQMFSTFEPGVFYYFEMEVSNLKATLDVWTYAVEDDEKNYAVGGLRIKEIRAMPGTTPSDLDMITSYSYNKDESAESSGVLLFDNISLGYASHHGSGRYVEFSDHPYSPLTNFEGYHIGYTNVTEGKNGCGKKIFRYFFSNESYDDKIFIPMVPQKMDVVNGQEKERTILDESGKIVASEKQNPSITNYDLIPGLFYRTGSYTWKWPDPFTGKCFEYLNVYFRHYEPRTGAYRVKETVSEVDGVISTNSNIYGSTDDILISKGSRMINCDNKIHITESLYAKDFPNDPVCTEMVSRNMIYVPLETTTTIDGNPVSGEKSLYAFFGNGVYPQDFYRMESGVWVFDGNVGGYSNGKPTAYIKSFYPPINYTWDGDNMISKSFAGHLTSYLYHPGTNLVEKVTEADGQTTSFGYDGLMRLINIRKNNVINEVITHQYQPNIITKVINYGDAENIDKTYFDGLGREVQTKKVAYGPTHNDIDSYTVYDKFGSVQKKTYLPGNFVTYKYELSPLRRLLEETYPGGSSKKYEYGSNDWTVKQADWDGIVWPYGSYYRPLTLHKAKSIDEDGRFVEEFTDLVGKKVLVRRPAIEDQSTPPPDPDYIDTYYGYNGKDQLAAVRTPGGLRYLYNYNPQDLLQNATIPGKGTTTFLYNNRRQLQSETDPKMQKLEYQYDDFDRMTKTSFNGVDLINNTYDMGPQINKGKLTEKVVKVLGLGNVVAGEIQTINEYDQIFGRLKKEKKTRTITGSAPTMDESNYTLSNAGWMKDINRQLTVGGSNWPLLTSHHLDHSGRTISTDFQIGTVMTYGIGEYEYNDYDKVKTQYIGLPTMARAQKREYEYTNRGWLTKINKMPLPGKINSLKICNEKNPYDRNDNIDSTNCQLCDYDSGLIESLSTIYGIYVNGQLMNLPHYPYNPFFANLTLKLDIENWLTANGFVFQTVTVDVLNEFYRIKITQTNAVFNYIEVRGVNGGGSVIDFTSANCDGGNPFICNFESEFINDTFNIDALWYTTSSGSALVPLNYQYGNHTSKPLSMFVTDLQSWLVANNHQGTVSIVGTNPFAVSIVGTDVQFYKIGLKGYRDCYPAHDCPCTENQTFGGGADLCTSIAYFTQECEQYLPSGGSAPPDTLMVLQLPKDICDLCESKGYPCYKCPFNKLGMDSCAICQQIQIDDCTKCKKEPDVCVRCHKLGYEDCATCPLTVDRVLPQELVVDYNLTDLQQGTGVSMPRFTLRTNYQKHSGDMESGKSIRNVPLHGYGANTSSTANTHTFTINLSDLLISSTAIASAITTLQGRLSTAITGTGANSAQDISAIMTTVIETAEEDWGMAALGPPTGPPSGNNLPPTLFALDLRYDNPEAYYAVPPRKNGSISTMSWQVYNRNKFHYAYSYDVLDRILKGSFAEIGTSVKRGLYDEKLEYDRDGNIMSLVRNGEVGTCIGATSMLYGKMDNLSYSYGNNRLMNVTDQGSGRHGFKAPDSPFGFYSDYVYDNNGNMENDGAKSANISYNVTNLPARITLPTGPIDYLYTAESEKVRVIGSNGKWTDYFSGVLVDDLGNLVEAATPEGRAVPYTSAPGGILIEGALKDHLGDVRVIFSDIDGNGAIDFLNDDDPENMRNIRQEHHYYPFGLEFEGYWKNTISTKPSPFRYNGKEWQSDIGWNDYGARHYDPVVGRWWSVDPLALKLSSYSPYAYCVNNPIRLLDPDGAFPIEIHVRSFAPFNYFGGGLWKGDGSNRGFSTSYSGNTSRIRQITSYETTTMAKSSTAYGAQSQSRFGANAFSDAKIEDDFSFGNRIYTHLSGDNDALIPGVDYGGPTHDIDVWTDVHIGVSVNKDGSSILSLTGDLAGDGFPSSEAFVSDGSGKNKVFLGVGAAKAGPNKGPFITLAGDKKEKQFDINVRIAVDKKGNFTGVYSTDAKGNETIIPIADWNKQYENQSPK